MVCMIFLRRGILPSLASALLPGTGQGGRA